MPKEQIINFSEPKEMAVILAQVQLLRGLHRISIVKHRPRRTDRQNRWYWPCFVGVFADWLREQGEEVTDDQVHEMLKNRFLRQTAIDRLTGEVIGDFTRSTTSLDTTEFNRYLDRIQAWLGETFGIQVPDPSMYHEIEADPV